VRSKLDQIILQSSKDGTKAAVVNSKLDQLMHQASKDATKAAAVKAAKTERRIATAMYAKWDSALSPSGARGRRHMCRTQVHARRGDVGARL
jgi:GH25 family lysozyme M1 (1,4-beta-N-acetylmuramidase)